ncbi:MAG: hypothetical protein WA102_09200 [Candidatus Methanoperedens sp.]
MWKRLDVVFTLKSPLHIGYLPSKGSVISRTRYYVPGKNFWGAITKGATENLFDYPDAKNYIEIGEQIKNSFRFMYFYLYNGKTEYTPEFTNSGLKYGTVDVLEFERKFIGSRISTAIDGTKGTAKDESLHEIEFINNKYRDGNGTIRNTKLIGVIWVKEGAVLSDKDGEKKVGISNQGIFVDGFNFNLIEKLILGGEQNYGFGLVELESINKERFPIDDVNTNDENIIINIKKGNPIFSHLKYDKNVSFQGDLELLSGREYQKKSERYRNPGEYPVPPAYYFSPGTRLISVDEKQLILERDGIII